MLLQFLTKGQSVSTTKQRQTKLDTKKVHRIQEKKETPAQKKRQQKKQELFDDNDSENNNEEDDTDLSDDDLTTKTAKSTKSKHLANSKMDDSDFDDDSSDEDSNDCLNTTRNSVASGSSQQCQSASGSFINSESLFDLMMNSKNRDAYFWQYNIQSKGPKTKKVLTLRNKDPHLHRDFFDPVFQLQSLNARGGTAVNKLRKGNLFR